MSVTEAPNVTQKKVSDFVRKSEFLARGRAETVQFDEQSPILQSKKSAVKRQLLLHYFRDTESVSQRLQWLLSALTFHKALNAAIYILLTNEGRDSL
jgi:hypothetical protein